MSNNSPKKYDEEFKKSLVTLFQNGKTRTQLSKEYGISQSALAKWIKQYSTVEAHDGQVLTAKQIKELQKRNAQLEEENPVSYTHLAAFFTTVSATSSRSSADIRYISPVVPQGYRH